MRYPIIREMILAVSVIGLANSACAQPVFIGITATLTGSPETAKLVDINPLTGEASNPRDTGIQYMAGIAAQPATGIVFGLTSFASSPANALVRFNITTGIPSLVGMTGLSTIVEGDLAFNPINGFLYGIQEVGPLADHASLFRIDPSSGVATIVGNMMPIGDFSAMAFTPAGALYTIDTQGAGNSVMYAVDPNTAALTGALTLSANLGSGAGMAIDAGTGIVYVADGGMFATNSLYTLDPATGIVSLIGPVGTPGGIAGLTFNSTVPEPSSIFLTGIVVAAVYCRRRFASSNRLEAD